MCLHIVVMPKQSYDVYSAFANPHVRHKCDHFAKLRVSWQEELGNERAKQMCRNIGASYAQKKIARYEAEWSAPTLEELDAMALLLEVDVEILRWLISTRARHEAESLIKEFGAGGRSLIASCMMSRQRSKTWDDTFVGHQGSR